MVLLVAAEINGGRVQDVLTRFNAVNNIKDAAAIGGQMNGGNSYLLWPMQEALSL